MLDFSNLKTPASHGDVLVTPAPSAWVAAARENFDSLSAARAPLLDSTLGEWRRRTREAIVGRDDTLVFVTGHQPEFIHPGVWAKHVVAQRAAEAVDGVAVNLVVDHDAPKTNSVLVPAVQGTALTLRPIPFAESLRGFSFEQIARLQPDQVDRFESNLRQCLGERYEASQMPTFFRGVREAAGDADWVGQVVAGRRAIENALGVMIEDRRISDIWCSPLLLDFLVNAERFAASYNRALAWYRREFRVRGAQRPIPDLHCQGGQCEVAAWAYRCDQPRQRLFAARVAGAVELFAGGVRIGVVPERHLRACSDLAAVLDDMAGWRLRPRALTLTIWARLLLADLFIHGIGGAKYDRISDVIIEDYYDVSAPHMACASATLHMDLPGSGMGFDSSAAVDRSLRDLRFNPQRNLRTGEDLVALEEQRRDAIACSDRLRESDGRNRSARRDAFDRLRQVNDAMLDARRGEVESRRVELGQAKEALRRDKIATSREHFFGFYDAQRLRSLLAGLPDVGAFRL